MTSAVALGRKGVTLVNIGVGLSNAKNITDHLAVLRPNCWLMVGHCGGLRQSQQIGDYVLAHGYLRQDRILQAIHAKLDEILHALGDARNEITRMDEKEPEEIERRREQMRKDD
jgi:AMP nucleosidase